MMIFSARYCAWRRWGHRLVSSLRLTAALAALWAGLAWCGPTASAQDAPEKPETSQTKREIPPETDEEIETDDGLVMKATFYPGVNGNETVPVLMLHGWKGTRADYHKLAKQLQSDYGHAVLVPDLRGHGESVRMKGDLKSPPLTPERLKPDDLQRMAMEDMESLRRFLKRHNNDGKLNLDKLCLVGADVGALLAVKWSAYDWSAPSLARMKQSQFVKGLVLLSPEWSFRRMQVGEALKTVGAADKLSVFVLYGRKNSATAKTAQRVISDLQKSRPNDAKETDVTKKTLWMDDTDTTLQGAQMLGQSLDIEELIAKFIELQVVTKNSPWQTYESISK